MCKLRTNDKLNKDPLLKKKFNITNTLSHLYKTHLNKKCCAYKKIFNRYLNFALNIQIYNKN